MAENEYKRRVREQLATLFDALPHEDHEQRLAACVHLLVEASGLTTDQASYAMATFAAVIHNAHVDLRVHHRDGSIVTFKSPDFDFDIHPASLEEVKQNVAQVRARLTQVHEALAVDDINAALDVLSAAQQYLEQAAEGVGKAAGSAGHL